MYNFSVSQIFKTTMIYRKAGEAIKRRAIEKLEDGAYDGQKMVKLGFAVTEPEEGSKEEK